MSNGRPAAAEVAKIQTHLTHAIVTGEGVDGLNVFRDGQLVLPGAVDSLSVEIVAPTDADPVGKITAILAYYETGADGVRTQKAAALFPGTVEIIARGRRLSLSCAEQGAFEGLWLGLGMAPDGTSTELTGVASLRVLLSPGLHEAKLVWSDGGEETIL